MVRITSFTLLPLRLQGMPRTRAHRFPGRRMGPGVAARSAKAPNLPVGHRQRLAPVSDLHGPGDIADRAGALSNQNGRCSARWAVPGSRGSPQQGGQRDSPPPRNPVPSGDSYRSLMRTAAFLRNVPILAGLPDESLERLAGQVNDVLIGLMDWKALPRVVDPGRRAARDALEASPEPLSRLGS